MSKVPCLAVKSHNLDCGGKNDSMITTEVCRMVDCGRKKYGMGAMYEGDDDGTVSTDKRVRYLYPTHDKVRNTFRRVEWVTDLIYPQDLIAYIGPVVS